MFGISELFLSGVASGVLVCLVVVFLLTEFNVEASFVRSGVIGGVGIAILSVLLYGGSMSSVFWMNLIISVGGVIGCVVFVHWGILESASSSD